jgi:hypothetical protein
LAADGKSKCRQSIFGFCGRPVCYDISTDVQHLLNVEGEPSKVSCPSGSADAILALVNAGADVNAADKDGLTGELMHLFFKIKVGDVLYSTPALA